MCEHAAGQRIEFCKLPTASDLRQRHQQRLQDGIRALLSSGEAGDVSAIIQPLLADHPAADVAAAAVAYALRITCTIDDEPDIPQPEMTRPRPGSVKREPRVPFRGRRFGPGNSSSSMVRVFIGAGRRDGVGRRDMLDAMGQEVGLTPRDIGTIEVADRFCVVEVPSDIADHAIDSLQGARFGNRKVVVRRDRAEAPKG
jgi:ATP-dependent RNA helicase DeaD